MRASVCRIARVCVPKCESVCYCGARVINERGRNDLCSNLSGIKQKQRRIVANNQKLINMRTGRFVIILLTDISRSCLRKSVSISDILNQKLPSNALNERK